MEDEHSNIVSFRTDLIDFYENMEVFLQSFNKLSSQDTTSQLTNYVRFFLSFMARNIKEYHKYLKPSIIHDIML